MRLEVTSGGGSKTFGRSCACGSVQGEDHVAHPFRRRPAFAGSTLMPFTTFMRVPSYKKGLLRHDADDTLCTGASVVQRQLREAVAAYSIDVVQAAPSRERSHADVQSIEPST